MEQVLKATQEQYEELNGYTVENNKLEFFKDSNDNWVVDTGVLNVPAFIDIKPILIHKLERIDYSPKLEE